jgi:hypothetical protein
VIDAQIARAGPSEQRALEIQLYDSVYYFRDRPMSEPE